MIDGVAAGAAFGVLFIAMAKAGQHSGLWPIAMARCCHNPIAGPGRIPARRVIRWLGSVARCLVLLRENRWLAATSQ